MSTPLHLLEAMLLRDLGQTLEGDIFQALKSSSRYILRAWEFALSDGAIDCSRTWPLDMSYADKLRHLFSHGPESTRSDIALFDIKSSSAVDDHGHRRYWSTIAQRLRVAFYIGVSAADPKWIDLIPNYHQDPNALQHDAEDDWEEESKGNVEQINVCRDSRLHDAAHGSLDVCATPYRMPISMLDEAISRVRSCALGLGDFVNPWTGVIYRGWRPLLTRRTCFLKPYEDNAHYTAFEEAWDVFTAVKTKGKMAFDLVGLQPNLADFKLMYFRGPCLIQALCQAKSEGHQRSAKSKLNKVAVSRQGRHFFDARDR
jgi:hypothetical protein